MFFRSRKIQKPLPDSVEECLALSVTAADPRDRRKYVDRALEIDGDDLKANRALLMLGRHDQEGDLSRRIVERSGIPAPRYRPGCLPPGSPRNIRGKE